MNEKLNELATQAELISEEYNGFDRVNLKPSEKKFAELIIKECLEVCSALSDEYHEAAMVQGINNQNQIKALSIAKIRMVAKFKE